MAIDNVKARQLFLELNKNNDNVINKDDKLDTNILKALGIIDENGNYTNTVYTLDDIAKNYETIEEKIANAKAKIESQKGQEGNNELANKPNFGDLKNNPKDSDGSMHPDEFDGNNNSNVGNHPTDDLKNNPKDSDGSMHPDEFDAEQQSQADNINSKKQPGKQVVRNGKRVILMPSGDIYDMNGRKIGHETPQ